MGPRADAEAQAVVAKVRAHDCFVEGVQVECVCEVKQGVWEAKLDEVGADGGVELAAGEQEGEVG